MDDYKLIDNFQVFTIKEINELGNLIAFHITKNGDLNLCVTSKPITFKFLQDCWYYFRNENHKTNYTIPSSFEEDLYSQMQLENVFNNFINDIETTSLRFISKDKHNLYIMKVPTDIKKDNKEKEYIILSITQSVDYLELLLNNKEKELINDNRVLLILNEKCFQTKEEFAKYITDRYIFLYKKPRTRLENSELSLISIYLSSGLNKPLIPI